MRKINWGIIGLGKMALEFAKCFSHLDNVNLKGVASQKKENLKIFKRFGVDDKFCFNNYDDLNFNNNEFIISTEDGYKLS